MIPITGPYSKTISLNGPPTSLGFKPQHLWVKRTWLRQRKPWDTPLAFTFESRRVTRSVRYSASSYFSTSDCIYWVDGVASADAWNKARGRLIEKLGDFASWGASIGERKQAMGMMADRLGQIFRIGKALKNGNFVGALSQMNLHQHFQLVPSPKRLRSKIRTYRTTSGFSYKVGKRVKWVPAGHEVRFDLRKSSKALANNFLEVHFGWEPLVKDIYATASILSELWPPIRVKASATCHNTWTEYTGTNPVNQRIYKHRVTWKCGCQLLPNDGNFDLARRMGLTDPAAVAWELVPFSFVFDWFVNVGDFLQSFNDLASFNTKNPWRTLFSDTTQEYRPYYSYPPSNPQSKDLMCGQTVKVERTTGIPGVILQVRSPWRISPTRGATMASLLVQLFVKTR